MSARRVVYAISTALAVAAFAGSGLANVLRLDHVAHDMARLGYPPYFMSVLGTWRVLGAIVIAASRAAIGDGLGTVVAPLAVAMIVVASWATRPAARTCAPPCSTAV